jgi:GAF domain-containing protein
MDTPTHRDEGRERGRLAALLELAALDTPPNPGLDELVEFARVRFQVPIALVSLLDETRQWFKAKAGLRTSGTPRADAFCDRTIARDDVTVVPDAATDPRFAGNPLVLGPPYIRFYAGAPLEYGGQRVGSFCVVDVEPRGFGERDRHDLKVLARAAVAELEMEKARRFL